MRILDQSKVMIQLEKLGMLPQALERLHARPSARPTASCSSPARPARGKTTTLYGALNQLNTIEKHIITVEDPVEYQLEGITQVPGQPKASA